MPKNEHEARHQQHLRALKELLGESNFRLFNLGRQIKVAGQLLGSLTGADTEEGRISSARMRILMRLATEEQLGGEGLSPSELSRFLGVSRNTVSALLNGLEDQGLVARALHPTDRRQIIITLTPEGKTLYTNHSPHFAHYLEQIFSTLTLDEQATLYDLLIKLNTGMKQRLQRTDTPCNEQAENDRDDDPDNDPTS